MDSDVGAGRTRLLLVCVICSAAETVLASARLLVVLRLARIPVVCILCRIQQHCCKRYPRKTIGNNALKALMHRVL